MLAYPRNNFAKWYLKRLARVIPVTLIIVLINLSISGEWKQFAGMDFIDIIAYYPQRFWFITALLIYCVIYYIVFASTDKTTVIKQAVFALSIWGILYFFLYFYVVDRTTFVVELEGLSWFKVYFYFGIMIMGGICRIKKEYIVARLTDKKVFKIIWGVEYSTFIRYFMGYHLHVNHCLQ